MTLDVRLRYGALLACAVVVLAGCADDAPPPAHAAPESVQQALNDARADDETSAQQLETLETAVREGRNVSEGEYRNAYSSAVECVEEAGVVVLGVDEYWNAGVLQLSMSFSSSLEEENLSWTIIGDCENSHVTYVASARNSREAVEAAQDAVIEQYLPSLRECVRDRGYTVANDADYVEVTNLDLRANQEAGTETGCMESTGFMAAMTGPPQ